ncbi:hypothetical protein [Cellulomonas sp. SG140]|uniref:hypothetical protein n=1 Tax=Cellulomonas sp. SG140 TaxID=2976536 RepID=UPI0021E6D8E5|nr:hypothetical protein [Cellulomonas sp. SG140]
MRAVVVHAWARSAAGAVVHADGGVEWRNARPVAGEDDPAAVTAALALAGADGEVVGLTLGDADPSWSLARGAARAVRVTDAPIADDEGTTAAVIAAAVRSVADVDVVVVGDSEEHAGVAAAVGAALGWPVVTGIVSAAPSGAGIEAVRPSGDVQETLLVPCPAVLGVVAEGAEARTPGMKEQLAARKRPVLTTTLAELGAPGLAAPSTVQVRGTRLPDQATTRVFEGDADETARQLVAALRAEGVL